MMACSIPMEKIVINTSLVVLGYHGINQLPYWMARSTVRKERDAARKELEELSARLEAKKRELADREDVLRKLPARKDLADREDVLKRMY